MDAQVGKLQKLNFLEIELSGCAEIKKEGEQEEGRESRGGAGGEIMRKTEKAINKI